MISIVLMLDTLNNSVRVRLPEFQKRYRQGVFVVIGFLSLTAMVMVFHKAMYYAIDNPDKHFAKRIYKPYDLAKTLKSKGIQCFDTDSQRERLQLRYYNILPCSD